MFTNVLIVTMAYACIVYSVGTFIKSFKLCMNVGSLEKIWKIETSRKLKKYPPWSYHLEKTTE